MGPRGDVAAGHRQCTRPSSACGGGRKPGSISRPSYGMSQRMGDTLTRVMPSATPTKEEIAAWNELSREEQLKRYRELFSHPDTMTDCGQTMEDILAEAHRRSDQSRRG